LGEIPEREQKITTILLQNSESLPNSVVIQHSLLKKFKIKNYRSSSQMCLPLYRDGK